MKKLYALAALLSLTLSFAQAKQENLKITWPEEYKWKVVTNQEDETTHFIEVIPGKEKLEKWTMIGTMLSLKNVKISTTAQVVEFYRQSSLEESPQAKLTVLESSDTAKNIWVIFKVDTPSFPNDPNPESQVYYAVQGESTLYVNFVAVKQKTLQKDFIEKWVKVFKASELLYL